MDISLLFEILPDGVTAALDKFPLNKIYELRLRANLEGVVCIDGRNMPLGVTVSRIDLDNILHKAANYAIYSVNDQICKGFITVRGGIRIGICGEVVTTGREVSTIKNISTMCIRIPHEVKNCCYPVLPYIFAGKRPCKTLIIAPPGAGKTTFLRDISVQISKNYPRLNTLILDERGEIAANYLGDNQLFVGDFCDVITGGSKQFGFENGLRSMRPDVVITDEIATHEDAKMIKSATRSGVAVMASVHAADIDEIRVKPAFIDLIQERVFERFIVLAVRDHAGEVVGVYDGNLKCLFTSGS